jgi:MoxR-like ATPase
VIERILATVPPPQPVWRDGNEHGAGRPEFV